LPVGIYGIKYTTAGQYDVDLPNQRIDAGQVLTTGIPGPGVLTVYAKSVSPDTEAPSTPAGLVAKALSSSQIDLTWTASTDNVAVAGYRIYRDGIEIAFSPTNSYKDTSVLPATTYVYRVSAYDLAGNESEKSPSATATTQSLNLNSGLVGYWKFDEGSGTLAADSSGHNNDGAVMGPAWVAGKEGHALDFDGLNDYVPVVVNPALDNLDEFTMAAWIYPRVDSHWHVLDKGDGDKRIYAEGTDLTLNGRVRYTGAHAYSESSPNTVSLNTWQHIALTWSAADDTTRLYRNGSEVNYTVHDIGTGSVEDDTAYPYAIGSRGALGEVTFFRGVIDEVRLYSRALSPGEVWGLYVYVSPAHLGDLNQDYKINFGDLRLLTASWLWLGLAGGISEDLIKDGVVNLPDFACLAENWLNSWNQPPFVRITAPHDGAVIYFRPELLVDIEADATDVDGSIVSVEFFVHGDTISDDNDGTDGWHANWLVPAVGSYSLTAAATDDAGAKMASPAIRITVVKPQR
ncbi:MAG: hypothetical protein JSU70_00515, partial [Phycisphaerales bacterium]